MKKTTCQYLPAGKTNNKAQASNKNALSIKLNKWTRFNFVNKNKKNNWGILEYNLGKIRPTHPCYFITWSVVIEHFTLPLPPHNYLFIYLFLS